jgi:hypothetical protein
VKGAFWKNRTAGPIRAFHPEKKKVILVDPQRDARIGSDINKEMHRMPALYGWYAQLCDEAEMLLREARHEEHNVAEDLDREIREKKPRPRTETGVKMAVKRHPRMREAFRNRMDALDMYNRLKSAVEIMKQKSYALGNLSKTNTSEYNVRDSA